MSVTEIERQIPSLPEAEQDRLAAYLAYLRTKREESAEDQDSFTSWKSVRPEFISQEG